MNSLLLKGRGSCTECQRRKRKCDKKRPCCTLCQTRNRQCLYSDFKIYNGPKRSKKPERQLIMTRIPEMEESSNFWPFYIKYTSRFCAVHELSTPFLSTLVPMAEYYPHLRSSLQRLSYVHYKKLRLISSDNDLEEAKFLQSSIRGLKQFLQKEISAHPEILASIATSLALSVSYIGEGKLHSYSTHLNGALSIAVNCLILRPNFPYDENTWFVMKWLTYSLVLCCIGQTYASNIGDIINIKYMNILYKWWVVNLSTDPDYSSLVDPFYGFSTTLAVQLLRMTIILCSKVDIDEDELSTIECTLWELHQASFEQKIGKLGLSQSERDLMHSDNAFHSAALLFFYTRLRYNKSAINLLTESICSEAQLIGPESRTCAALLFVLFIAGGESNGLRREEIIDYLELRKALYLTDTSSIIAALKHLWELRDTSDLSADESFRVLARRHPMICLY